MPVVDIAVEANDPEERVARFQECCGLRERREPGHQVLRHAGTQLLEVGARMRRDDVAEALEQCLGEHLSSAVRFRRLRASTQPGFLIATTGGMPGPWFERTRRVGTALALMGFPLVFVAVYAMHPNLLAFKPLLTLDDWMGRFHNRPLLHAAHAVMTLAVPLLVVSAYHFAHVLRGRGAWFGLVGGAMAILGAVILAADKGALCLVPSAFDTLPPAAFEALRPGLVVMQARDGWLAILWLLPLLPLGFAVQGIGLLRERLIGRVQGAALIAGSLLLANPDIEALSLVASLLLTAALWPYGLRLLRRSAIDLAL